MDITFYPQGDRAVTVHFGTEIHKDTHQKVKNFTDQLTENPFEGLLEVTPGYTTVTIFYDPIQMRRSNLEMAPYEEIVNILRSKVEKLTLNTTQIPRSVTIPVCYGGKYGPDLKYVADYHQLTEQQVIDIHTQQEYLVYMIGFAPGFPYLGGMSKKIATPRMDTPRLSIPVGSVGIGGEQTGVYPIESPGGWQLIGRTPLILFQANREQPSLLKAGDIVRFQPITPDVFESWEDEQS